MHAHAEWDHPSDYRNPAPLSAKFAVLRIHLVLIADLTERANAYKILAEIEQRTRPLGVRGISVDPDLQYPPPELVACEQSAKSASNAAHSAPSPFTVSQRIFGWLRFTKLWTR